MYAKNLYTNVVGVIWYNELFTSKHSVNIFVKFIYFILFHVIYVISKNSKE